MIRWKKPSTFFERKLPSVCECFMIIFGYSPFKIFDRPVPYTEWFKDVIHFLFFHRNEEYFSTNSIFYFTTILIFIFLIYLYLISSKLLYISIYGTKIILFFLPQWIFNNIKGIRIKNKFHFPTRITKILCIDRHKKKEQILSINLYNFIF